MIIDDMRNDLHKINIFCKSFMNFADHKIIEGGSGHYQSLTSKYSESYNFN